jgi:hypothetical protein
MSNSAITTRKTSALEISGNTLTGLKSAANAAVSVYAEAEGGDIVAAIQAATAINALRTYFDDPGIKEAIIALQDCPLGFRTDRDPAIKKKNKDGNYIPNTAYPYEVVKEAAIEALLRGLQLVGNQFNIIAGRCYCTKEGFEHLIRMAPIADLQLRIGVPKTAQGSAVVECSATWNQGGKIREFDAVIPVKADPYSTADQLVGKATRKFLARCYQQMTGKVLTDGDSSEPQSQPVAGSTPPLAALKPQAMDPTVIYQQAQSASPGATQEAVLSDDQYARLTNAMAKQLSALGGRAFEADVCACFGVESLPELPADQFKAVISGLANSTSVERWNQGCASGSGEQILSTEELNDLQSAQAEPSDEDEVQGALI